MDKHGHFTFYLPFFKWPPWTFYWPLPHYAPSTSSCPRSYWMPPTAKWGLVPLAPIWPQLTWVLAWSMIVAGKPRTSNKNKEWFFFYFTALLSTRSGRKKSGREFFYIYWKYIKEIDPIILLQLALFLPLALCNGLGRDVHFFIICLAKNVFRNGRNTQFWLLQLK